MNLQIPKEATLYINFQRTQYQTLWSNFVLRQLLKIVHVPYNWIVKLDTSIFRRKVGRLFQSDMKDEYEDIKDYLPKSTNAILDIGCGVAGIDAFLYNHYSKKPDLYLLDKTKTDEKVFYNYKNKGSFYNSLSVAKNLLTRNGVSESNIHLMEIGDQGSAWLNLPKIDVTVSLISWGFHYPVSTYLDAVYTALNDSGVLILDIRKGTNGEKEVEKRFGNIEIISETQKKLRILAVKEA